jgi:hypothetical protein
VYPLSTTMSLWTKIGIFWAGYCIKFCEMQKLPLRGHDESETSYNREIFLDLVLELASFDGVLDEHLRSATVSKNT